MIISLCDVHNDLPVTLGLGLGLGTHVRLVAGDTPVSEVQ